MLIIGSQAAQFHKLTDRFPNDSDVIGTYSELQSFIKAVKETTGIKISAPLSADKWHIRGGDGWNYEFEIAWVGSSGEALISLECAEEGREAFASKEALLALKLSHRYLKDSPHFLKTMRDIQHMRDSGIELTPELEAWLPQREAETYVYKHPKLDVSKGDFFKGDGVNYVYDHDSLHLAVALLSEYHDVLGVVETKVPAYTRYMQDGAAVMTDKEKFMASPYFVRLYGVYEESCVLALERSQIPFDFKPDAEYSFKLALSKVCTSITSGWFREFAWENYDSVVDLYNRLGHNDYIERFKANQHLLKPYNKEEAY
jgi:hypothetical protein